MSPGTDTSNNEADEDHAVLEYIEAVHEPESHGPPFWHGDAAANRLAAPPNWTEPTRTWHDNSANGRLGAMATSPGWRSASCVPHFRTRFVTA